ATRALALSTRRARRRPHSFNGESCLLRYKPAASNSKLRIIRSAALGDPPGEVDFAGLVASGREPEIRSDVPGFGETLRLVNGGEISHRSRWAYSWDRHQASADRTERRGFDDRPVQLADLDCKLRPGRQQRPDHHDDGAIFGHAFEDEALEAAALARR